MFVKENPDRKKKKNKKNNNNNNNNNLFLTQCLTNFVDCESFLESNSPDILGLCQTNLDDSIDSGNFSVRGYPSII